MTRRVKAQSIAEYVICFTAVVAAVIAMQVYVKRGLQGRLRDLALQTTARYSATGKTQYEPYYHTESFTINKNTDFNEDIRARGWRNKNNILDSADRNGNSVEDINCYDDP